MLVFKIHSKYNNELKFKDAFDINVMNYDSFLVDAFLTNATPRCMTIVTLGHNKEDCLVVGETDGPRDGRCATLVVGRKTPHLTWGVRVG